MPPLLCTCRGVGGAGLTALVSPLSGSKNWDPGLWGRASQMWPWRSGLCQAPAALLCPRALGWPPVIGEEEVGDDPQEQLCGALRGLCWGRLRGCVWLSEAWPEWLASGT